MSDKIPQHASINLSFENLSYNVEPTNIDLTTLDDIVLAIASSVNISTPILRLQYSSQPSRFTIDNLNKKIQISILGNDGITNNLGKYYMNLWLEKGGEKMTHFMESFSVVKTVPPS